MGVTRFLFATDLHGSEIVWKKFLNSAKYFGLDALIISGDMTGKLILPIVRQGDGGYLTHWLGRSYKLGDTELTQLGGKARGAGYIPYITFPEEAEELARNEDKREELFRRLQIEMVRRWLSLVPQRLPNRCKLILTPGNDDSLVIDEVLRGDPNVLFGEGEVHLLDEEHEVACCGWTNPTPWKTPRECSEDALYAKLERVASKIRDPSRSVFCFHCPPYDSQIDYAAKLKADLTPEYAHGRPVMVPVGSKSVRAIIEKYQPLLSLHGHIHESPGFVNIGSTRCLNPGSEYSEGILRGYLVELQGDKIKKLQRIES